MKHSIVFLMFSLMFAVGCDALPFLPEPTATPAPKPRLPPPQPRATKAPPTLEQKPGAPITPPQKPGANFTPLPKPGANITPPAVPDGAAKTYAVTNPTTNAKLAVYVFAPPDPSGKKFPAVILVPGGNGAGQGLSREATQFANAGIVAIAFDPDGRGKSEGTEDYAGFKHQDGLAAVIRFAATLPQVNAQPIGIVTYSYGITLGSGALARYPDLPVKFLVDWEGPMDRNDTGGCDKSGTGHLKTVATCADEKFWSEREAITFIAQVRVPYQRVQSEKDHVQPEVTHAINLVNAAVQGGVPWVRLNDYPANQTYDPKSPPPLFPETQDRQRDGTIIQYAQELVKK